MKNIRVVIIYTLLLTLIRSENQTQNDVELNTSEFKIDNRRYQALEGYIGTGRETSKTRALFQYNFGSQTTIIGDLEQVNWGIKCNNNDPKYTNSCKILDDTEETDFYFNSLYKYKKATLYYRFYDVNKLNTDTIKPLPVNLVTGGQTWPLKYLGVLGLAPYGSFADYVRRMWDNNIGLLFAFETVDDCVDNERLEFNTHVVLNPVFDLSNDFIKLEMPLNSKTWNYRSDVWVRGTDFKYENTNLCFSSISNELIIIADPIVLCDSIRQMVCGPKALDDCNKYTANLSHAPEITFIFDKKELNVDSKYYIYFNEKEELNCRFGDISTLRSQQVCAEDTEVAVGKIFFEKFMPALIFNNDSTTELYLVPYYQFDDPRTTWWFFICGTCIGIGVAIIIFIIVKRRRDDDDIYYATSE